eukprot:scaffold3435_cov57-Cylindrotheca_fusiformis.AAC.3
MLDRLLQFQQREGHCLVPQNHIEDGARLGKWLSEQRQLKRTGKLESRRIQMLEEAGVAWHSQDCQWNEMFKLLLQYKDREGHTQVPHRHQEEGQNLGNWLSLQRVVKRRGALELDRQDRLEKAGVVFDPFTHQWESMLDRLLQFQQREGHCLVPHNHIEDGARLGKWLSEQRRFKRTGKLGSRRIQILEEAGVAWHSQDGQWNEMFKLLLQYKDREGHTQVPQTHQEEGQNLGNWLNRQRGAKRRGALELDRQDRLEKAGVVFDPFTHQWESMLDSLLQFQQREGHCLVPHNHIEDGARLGIWLVWQRQLKRTGKLESRRIQILEEAGVAWDAHEFKWNQMFKLLLQYKDREGHTLVPKNHQEEGQNLGNWLNRQRGAKRRGALELDRQDRLEKAGVVWDVQRLQSKRGIARVPNGHQENGDVRILAIGSERNSVCTELASKLDDEAASKPIGSCRVSTERRAAFGSQKPYRGRQTSRNMATDTAAADETNWKSYREPLDIDFGGCWRCISRSVVFGNVPQL